MCFVSTTEDSLYETGFILTKIKPQPTIVQVETIFKLEKILYGIQNALVEMIAPLAQLTLLGVNTSKD